MRDSQSCNANAPATGTKARAFAPTNDDAGLLTLEVQFDDLINELFAAQEASSDSLIFPDEQLPVQDSSQRDIDDESDREIRREIEGILARLYPIEQAIMQTPACTVAGLGVKARHAAYVMSQYWESSSIDGMDWHARTIRS